MSTLFVLVVILALAPAAIAVLCLVLYSAFLVVVGIPCWLATSAWEAFNRPRWTGRPA